MAGFGLYFSRNSFITNVKAGTCDYTECASGEITTWACNTGGCPAGTRRQCECVPPGVVGFFWCWGNCQCISDPSCSSSTCIEGATGGCGTNGCASSEKSICSGGTWTCYTDASCGGGASCAWTPTPSGCVTEGLLLPKWPPGTCVGGGLAGTDCRYDSDCADGSCDPFAGECNCNIPASNQCCTGLVVNHPINYACVCPTCTPTNPAKPQPLLQPPNGNIESTNDVFIDWTNVSSWGTGCPQSNSYKARYTPKVAANCPAQTAGYTNKNLGGVSSTTLYDLNWGTTYCWYSRAYNGSLGRNSDATWEFTTPKTASLDDLQISTAGTCGHSISGNSSVANVDNPITIMTEYSLDDNGVGVEDIDEILLAIVPNDVRNAPIVSEASIASVSNKYFMAKATINTVTPSLSQFSIVNTISYPYYGANANSGDLTNTFASATLLNLNGGAANNTHVEVVDANTVRVYWQIRFDDNYKYKSADDSLYAAVINGNIYTAGLRELLPGVWNSSTGSNTIDRSLSDEGNWGVNVQIPQITIGTPQVIANDKFTINWAVNGYGLSQADGYMWGNQAGYQLRRLLPTVAILNIPTAEPVDFSSSNIGVGIGLGKALGTHTYQTMSAQSVILQTKMSANDSACNRITDSGEALNLTDGWLMTVGGNGFAENFNTSVKQSNIAGELAYLNDYSYLSTYLSAVNEDSIGTPSRVSKNNYIVNGYNDWNDTPLKNVTFSTWIDYIKSLVDEHATVHQINYPYMEIGQTTEEYIESRTTLNITNDNFTQHVEINGNFSLLGNNKCNTRTIFFVQGNLTIAPNFEIQNRPTTSFSNLGSRNDSTPPLQTGCIFIVRGDVTVTGGAYKNYYDKIEAFFVVKDRFITNEDNGGNPLNARYDGLYIKGAVIANELLLGRNLRLLNNLNQPSEIIEFDPRYSNLFFQELKINEFSIREKSYQRNLYSQ